MLIRLLVLTLLTLAPSAVAFAQEAVAWEDFVDRMAAEDHDAEGYSDILFDHLYEIHCNPINLNTATEDELSQLPFLTTSQCRDILFHITVNGPMRSLGELMAIESLSAETRSWLMLFCRAGETAKAPEKSFKDIIRRPRHELTARTDMPFYTKAGYADVPQSILDKSPNKVYRGNSLYHSLRYRLTASDRLDIGLQMEKDPGERGIDYINAFALVKNIGMVRKAVVGNYRISFGQGLVVNTGSSFGKLMTLGSLGRMDQGIRPHSSTAESGRFTGAAATISIGSTADISAFVSHQKQDGTFLSDSSGISSLKTDGLHRTALERSKKGNITSTVAGGNIHFSLNRFALSFTGAFTHYSAPLRPKHDTPSSLYRLYNAQGTDFAAYSASYSYTAPRISLRGETAMSGNGAIATVNSLQWTASEHHRLTAVYRNYSARFVSIHGNSFGESATPQNEHGLYLGWTTTAIANTTLETYADIVHFPWLKYQVSGSSYLFEAMAQLTHRLNKRTTLSARYKFKTRQKDFTPDGAEEGTPSQLLFHNTHNLRLQCTHAPSKQLTLRTSLTATLKQLESLTTAKGFLISENLRWTPRSKQGRAELTLTYFNTDSYDSRISIYEPSLLYSFGFRSLYNHGIRTSLLASLPLSSIFSSTSLDLTLIGKLGNTIYFGQQSIGSGLELIPQNHRTDLQIQVRWKI
jgi:hypothetical protein